MIIYFALQDLTFLTNKLHDKATRRHSMCSYCTYLIKEDQLFDQIINRTSLIEKKDLNFTITIKLRKSVNCRRKRNDNTKEIEK